MAKFLLQNCCTEAETPAPGTPENGCCIVTWEDKLKVATNRYNSSNATTIVAREKYVNALSWQEQLKVWKVNIDATDQKSKEVLNAITFFQAKVNTVCEDSNNATNSIKKLTLLLKRIFDEFYTYKVTEPGLIYQMETLEYYIEYYKFCSSHKEKEQVETAVRCLRDSLKEVLALKDAILEGLINTLKHAFLLTTNICGAQGLKAKLQAMATYFDGKTIPNPDTLEAGKTVSGLPKDNASYPCTNKPGYTKPVFPINNSNPYFKKIKKELEDAITNTGDLETAWKNAKKQSDKDLSVKEGLIEAIKAAELAVGV